MLHGLSIDVEDYYQIIYRDFFQRSIPPSPEVEQNTNWILETFARAGIHATFFVLSNVARRYPELIKRIVGEGHEIGVHGSDHKYIYLMKPAEFKEEIRRAKQEIEEISGSIAVGHRAPAFSIRKEAFWAIDILWELGFMYDSSIYPVQTKRYGVKETEKSIYRWPNGLYEIPLSCLECLRKTVPVAGGGYIRHFPFWWTRYAFKRLEQLNRPVIVYMHPYEFEESYPRLANYGDNNVSLKLMIHNLLQGHNRGKKQRKKLQLLMAEFNFVPLRELIARHVDKNPRIETAPHGNTTSTK